MNEEEAEVFMVSLISVNEQMSFKQLVIFFCGIASKNRCQC
jgi:hypothetical protein